MKRLRIVALFAIALSLANAPALAIEQPPYTVQSKDRDFEVRMYQPYLVAEVTTVGDQKQSVRAGFQKLAAYIFGGNQGRAKIAMTSPVAQTPQGDKIAMTSPVTQNPTDPGQWSVQFMMPSAYRLENLPEPNDPDVNFRLVPRRAMAALTFSGVVNDRLYQEKSSALRGWVSDRGLQGRGEIVLAQYDPPWIPWFMRRNEVLLELAE